MVTEPHRTGWWIYGVRRSWDGSHPWRAAQVDRAGRRIVPDRGPQWRWVPFTAWASVFERTVRPDPRTLERPFPHVNPHRLRHSFLDVDVWSTLSRGHYLQAARLVSAAGADQVRTRR